MLSYAGYPLPLVTKQLEDWLEQYLVASRIKWYEPIFAGSPERSCTVMPRIDIQPEFRLSTLIWPTGLSKPATALFVATTAQLNAILAYVDAGATRIEAPLKIGNNVSVNMLLGDPVQVSGAPLATDGLWLLPLVDVRHGFNLDGTYTFDGTTHNTWAQWFAAAHTALGITCPVAAVDAHFLYPGPVYYPAADTPGLGIFCDSAAWTIGRRYVRQLNGDFELQQYTDGVTKSAPVNGFNVVAGTRQTQSPTLLPWNWRMTWHQGGVSTYDLTTAPGGWPTKTRWHGRRIIKSRCAIPDGSQTQADDYCKYLALETTKWKLLRQDLTFAGAVPYTLNGSDDRVEYYITSDTAQTRVYCSHDEAIEHVSVRFGALADAVCDNCGGTGGSADCPRVSAVQCTGGLLSVDYETSCNPVP